MRISRPQFLTILVFVIIAYPLLLTFPEGQIIAYGREDGPIEYAGAILYFLAAVTMIAAFVGVSSDGCSKLTKGNPYFLLLAAFFFVCFGEEISWGQRMIGWSTPDSVKVLNAQRETNLHNLWIFQAHDHTGAQKSQLALFLHPGRLIALFWLSYCLVIPLAYAAFHRVRYVLDYIRLPIPPLYIGLLFLAAYLTRKFLVLTLTPSMDIQAALGELQETLYAAIFFILALYFVRRSAGRGLRATGALAR